MNNKLLKNLERYMNKRKMNKTELANEIGLSASTVHSWWHRGTGNISISTLIKISRLFDITLDELVFGVANEGREELDIEEREVLRTIRKYYVKRIEINEK